MQIQLVDSATNRPFELSMPFLHGIGGEIRQQHTCELQLTDEADELFLESIADMSVVESALDIGAAKLLYRSHTHHNIYMHAVCRVLHEWMVEFPDGVWKVI